MRVTVYFANVAKKRNSTLQGTFSTSYDCVMKAPTSLDRPTFLVSAETMDYNAAKMGNRYYFIDDVVSVRNGQWEVSCVLDVLATYKADILASTQYVCYSSYNSSPWLPDTRIPVLRTEEYLEQPGMVPVFDPSGFYVLTVTGKRGCECYAVSKADIDDLISDIQDWVDDDIVKILTGTYDPNNPQSYQFDTTEHAIESLSKILTQSGCIGNGYQNAPQMIRSCIWVPFNESYFHSGSFPKRVYLGNYETQISAYAISAAPYSNEVEVSIPWKHSDWRRAMCETVYIRLPYAGLIQLAADTLTARDKLVVAYSMCAVDGTVAYQVKASNHTIGYYAGSCSAPYAIGINQRTGAGEVIQTAIAGIERTLATAIDSSLSPMSIAGAAAGAVLEGVNTVYQTANAAMSTNPSCIGSIGGAASAGLSQNVSVIVIAHTTVIEPSDMAATMGRPTMAPMGLSSLTGFCQCANAHIAAAAQATELNALDMFLNSGFFIE